MQIAKKALLVLLVASLLTVFEIPSALSASWYFGEDFDSTATGSMPSAVTFNAKQNTIGVVDTPGIGDKSAKIEITSADDAHINKTFSEPPTGKIIVEADIMVDNNTNSRKLITLRDSQERYVNPVIIDQSGTLLDATGTAVMSLVDGKFYKIALALDLTENTYSIFVNAKRRAHNVPLNAALQNAKIQDLYLLRFHVTNVVVPCATQMHINSIKVYEGSIPLRDNEIAQMNWDVKVGSSDFVDGEMIEKIMKNTLCFYEGSPNALVDGVSRRINASNSDVVPFSLGDSAFLPAEFAVKELGGTFSYSADTKTATVKLNNKNAEIMAGVPYMTADGVKVAIIASARDEQGTLFIPADALGELADLEVIQDECGLIALSNRENLFNWRDDMNVMSAVAGEMIYERPEGSAVIAQLISKNPNNAHPRLMATPETFERIRTEIAESEIKAQWFESVKVSTQNISKMNVIKYGTTDGIRMRAQSGQLADIVAQCAFVYNVTGEEEFAQRAWKEIEALCSFPDWNPNHFLDIGQFMMGMAVGYDWLYNYLSEDQRTLMRQNILEKAYKELLKDYFDEPRTRTYRWSTTTQPNNWNFVCNSGAIMTALAMGDEEPEICATVLHEAIRSIEGALNMFAPDGAWYEGPSYWTLCIETMAEAFSSLETAVGTHYGIMNAPGVSETGYFPYAVMGSTGTFNYSDANVIVVNSPEIFYLAEKLGDESLKILRTNHMLEQGFEGTYRDMIYCIGDPKTGKSDMSLDWNFRTADVITTRNTWDSTNMLFAGFHAGKNNAPHAHLDIGTFVIDSFGERFALDLGTEDYNLAGGFNKYRNRAQGHNTLTINPSMDMYDQVYTAYAYIDRFESNESSCLAVTDMTCAYAEKVDSAMRGLKMTNGRTTILVQDEVRSDVPVEIYWFMHTKADIEISDDGKTAALTIKGNKLNAKILTDEGTFFATDTTPLEGTPVVEGQNLNVGVKRLGIHFEAVTELDLAVAFRPDMFSEAAAGEYPAFVPLSQWTLDDPKNPVIIPEVPKVSDIKLDGISLSGFDPARQTYNISLERTDVPAPVVSAVSEHQTSVVYPDVWPGDVIINVDNGLYQNRYTLKFSVAPKSSLGDNYAEIRIIGAEALRVPQAENPPENSLDNEFTTRFSGDTPTWIMYDLGTARRIDYAALAFYSGAARKTIFDIEVSTDKANWIKVFDGMSSGESEGLEYYNLGNRTARYIRVNGYGTDANANWLSITEFKAYAQKDATATLPDTGEKATFIIGLYEKDPPALADVKVQSVTISAGSDISAKINVPKDYENYFIRTMLLSKNRLMPLTGAGGLS